MRKAKTDLPQLKQRVRQVMKQQVRPSLTALRERGDLSVLTLVMRDALGLTYQARSNVEHMQASMAWLCRAQDQPGDDGVAAFFDVAAGSWAPSYPETTGYIIPTFFNYADYSGDQAYRQRAVRMADWLLTVQLDSGAFPMGPLWADLARKPIVFDTGQIIHGLVRAYEETGRNEFLDSASRAGDWLTAIQEADGSWRKFTFLERVHTYNARVAWALLRIDQASGQKRFEQTAARKLDWVLTQQDRDGWFHNASFSLDEDPVTHTLAYTTRGLLESGLILDNRKWIEAACLAATALRTRQAEDGYLRGTYGPGWRSTAKWSCLTGNVQMAIIWFRLYQMTGEESFRQAAMVANHYLKRRQRLNSGWDAVDGGVAGSCPIYEAYHPYLYVNWAAKFLVDSLLLEEKIQEDIKWG